METITRQINIAVVDDHWAILEGYQSLLKKLNYVNSVHVFTTSKDFFEETKHTDFDLVLLDIELKEESGLDICKIIKEGNSKIKVIIESLHESKGFILHAYENNADGYIFKGGDYDELKNAINKIVFHNEKYFTPIASKIIFDKHESAKMHNSNSKTGLLRRNMSLSSGEIWKKNSAPLTGRSAAAAGTSVNGQPSAAPAGKCATPRHIGPS